MTVYPFKENPFSVYQEIIAGKFNTAETNALRDHL